MPEALGPFLIILLVVVFFLYLVKFLGKYSEKTPSKIHSYNDNELFSILKEIGASKINIGSPLYTYINLLDKWYILDKNPNFGPLKSPIEKAIFLAKIRLYSDIDIEKLFKRKSIKNSRDAIILFLDHEFTEEADKNTKETYEDMREEFINEIIPNIENAYMKKREITKEDLDPGTNTELIQKEMQEADCVFPRLTKEGEPKRNHHKNT